eukprot:CAMPEP_0184707078 /NCGR_PEP_ID=MMETSP0313-20130426/37088_1 /TAXON_ID=2792 /ORGANISM="Porphyridium aerugineum, Strain SAG 1380-2" /LENGTH=659 /DNA_ID=CAMNT_0027168651 /DNA_START=67 /DNA_END=2044 /DNA_ORIENTATION=+
MSKKQTKMANPSSCFIGAPLAPSISTSHATSPFHSSITRLGRRTGIHYKQGVNVKSQSMHKCKLYMNLDPNSNNHINKDEDQMQKKRDESKRLKEEAAKLSLQALEAELESEKLKLEALKKQVELENMKLKREQLEMEEKIAKLQGLQAKEPGPPLQFVKPTVPVNDERLPPGLDAPNASLPQKTEGASTEKEDDALGVLKKMFETEIVDVRDAKTVGEAWKRMWQFEGSAVFPLPEELKSKLPAGKAFVLIPLAEELKSKLPAGKAFVLKKGFGQEMLAMGIPTLEDEVVIPLLERVMLVSPIFRPDSLDVSSVFDRLAFFGTSTADGDVLLNTLEEQVKELALDDKVQIFVMENPKQGKNLNFFGMDDDKEDEIINVRKMKAKEKAAAAGLTERDVAVVIIPKARQPAQDVWVSMFAASSLAISIITSILYATSLYTPVAPDQTMEFVWPSEQLIQQAAPIWFGTMLIPIAIDAGNRMVAAFRGVKMGFSFFLPSIQLGCFGRLFNFIESFPRNRTDYFDIIMAGQLTGFALSLAAFAYGLVVTASGTGGSTFGELYPLVSPTLFDGSLLTHTMAAYLCPELIASKATSMAVHPLVITGYTGLLITSLNLLPIGKLDGGLLMQCMFGRLRSAFLSTGALFISALSLIMHDSDVLFFW